MTPAQAIQYIDCPACGDELALTGCNETCGCGAYLNPSGELLATNRYNEDGDDSPFGDE